MVHGECLQNAISSYDYMASCSNPAVEQSPKRRALRLILWRQAQRRWPGQGKLRHKNSICAQIPNGNLALLLAGIGGRDLQPRLGEAPPRVLRRATPGRGLAHIVGTPPSSIVLIRRPADPASSRGVTKSAPKNGYACWSPALRETRPEAVSDPVPLFCALFQLFRGMFLAPRPPNGTPAQLRAEGHCAV